MAALFIKFLCFCLLLIAILIIVKQQNKKLKISQENNEIKLVEKLDCSQNSHVCLIEYHGKKMLLGVTNNQFLVLDKESL